MRTGIVALLVGLPVLLVAGGYAWVRDEPLSADARAWLEQAQVEAVLQLANLLGKRRL